MDGVDPKELEMRLRGYIKTLCAPIWWESGRQVVVNSGTMCAVKTREAIIGITNQHVLEIYENAKATKHDIFCQLGSAPFDPTANLIDSNEYWDLATFSLPVETLNNFKHKVFVPKEWPPPPITMDDHVIFGGYPEIRRSLPPGPNPPTMSIDFVSFRRQPHSCTPEQVTFHADPGQVTWLPNVDKPLEPGSSVSGMSGGPCFRLVVAEDRIELGGFIYEGDFDMGIFFVRQAALISASGKIAPTPLNAGRRKRPLEERTM